MNLRYLLALSMLLFFCLASSPARTQTNLVNTEVEFAKGELAFVQKDYPAAERHFQNMVKRYPNSARAHYSLGAAYYAQGKKELAKAEFEQVIALKEPRSFVEKSQRYLAAIAGKSSPPKWYAVNLATGFRYDSNLFLDNDKFGIISDQDAPAWDAYLHGAVFPLRKDRFIAGLEYSFFNALYGEHSGFNFNHHRAGGIFQLKQGAFSVLFKPNFSATLVDSGGELFEMMGQFPVSLRFEAGSVAATEITYRFELENFSNVANKTFVINNAFLRDNLSHYPGIEQYFYFLDRKGYLNVGVTLAVENAHTPFDLWGPDVHARLGIPLPAAFHAEIFGGYFAKYYYNSDRPDIGYIPTAFERLDGQISAGANLKKIIYGPVWASAGYKYLKNDSNLFVFEYHKHTATFYVGLDF